MLLRLLLVDGTASAVDTSALDEATCTGNGLLQSTARIGLRSTLPAEDNEALVPDSAGDAAQQLRPNCATQAVDTVEYGIFLKAFHGVDMPHNSFTVDAITTLRWSDQRNIALLPENARSRRLSSEQAAAIMWLPDVMATNRVSGGIELISSSVFVAEDGSATKTERSLLTLYDSFDTENFPLDTQNLEVHLASTTYMLDEVQLVPTQDSSLWGTGANLFNNSAWFLLNTSLHSISDIDGSLQKSRGVLSLTVKRDASQYISTIFVPSCLLVIMAWMGLWFPLTTPFTMPRVAVSVISFLSMLTLSLRVDSMTASTGKATLMDGYLEMCVWLQFFYLLGGGCVAVIAYRTGDGAEFANKIDEELIISFPVVAVMFGGFVCFRPCGMWAVRIFAVSSIAMVIAIDMYRFKLFVLKLSHDKEGGVDESHSVSAS
jgi:hypothetical protein